jgi:hypothetical protein
MYIALKKYKDHFKKGDIVGMSDKYIGKLVKDGFLKKLSLEQETKEFEKLRKE